MDYDIEPNDVLQETIDNDTTQISSDPNTRFVITSAKLAPGKVVQEVIKLTKSPTDGFWRDEEGTIYAYADFKPGMDPRVRCGSGLFSLPAGDPRNELCAAHDFEYSCPVYAAYHTEEEANKELEDRFKLAGYPISGELFYDIVELIGKHFWPNPKTAT